MSEAAGREIFRLEHVSVCYEPGEPVLKDLSFSIDEGESICVLGANGSGKSTLLRLLAGLLFPAQGSFRAFESPVGEKDFDNTAFACRYHRRVGFVFQNTDAQLFCSTVREELAFGPLQLGLAQNEAEKRVEETARLLGISHLLEKTPLRLSGGEKKKTAIAAVLTMNPDVLLLDEPTEGLDPRTNRWLMGFLRALSGAGKTIILATHDLAMARKTANRALLFTEDGRLRAQLSVEDMLRQTELLREINLVDEDFSL